MSNKRARLRELLRGNRIIVAPGVFDCLGARLADRVGFDAAYLTGFGASSSLLGKPDLGFLTMTECVTHSKNINASISLPLIADAESGFGNALNVMRAVREFEEAGVAAIHLEDQIVPKKWKPDGKPQVVSLAEHADKIRAAVESRVDKDFLIIGRTDALGRFGLGEAIKRGNAYHEAGADVIFVHGAGSSEELETVGRNVHAPNLVNYSTLHESGNQPLPISRLEEMGFRIVIFPGELLFSAAKVMQEALMHLKTFGTMDGWLDRLMPLPEFFETLEWSKHTEYEKRWFPGKQKDEDDAG